MAKKKAAKKTATDVATTEPSFNELKDLAINNRYEAVILWDCFQGNFNGDPDNGNAVRLDDATGQGLATPMCLKRKHRNVVQLFGENGVVDPEFNDIYVKDRGILNDEHRKGYRAIGLPDDMGEAKKLLSNGAEPFMDRVRRWMCRHYYDIRTYGAMMATKIPVRSQRGPVQVTMSRSYHPVTPWDLPITRVAVTTREERESGSEHMMGRTNLQPYALFHTNVYVSALLAEKTGFSDGDLETLWKGLEEMFEHDHSASTGDMHCRGIYIFKHATRLGNARAKDLLGRVTATLKDPTTPPRCFEDYDVAVDDENLPDGIELITRV
jgi:CRISPR-associated protein Csd2